MSRPCSTASASASASWRWSTASAPPAAAAGCHLTCEARCTSSAVQGLASLGAPSAACASAALLSSATHRHSTSPLHLHRGIGKTPCAVATILLNREPADWRRRCYKKWREPTLEDYLSGHVEVWRGGGGRQRRHWRGCRLALAHLQLPVSWPVLQPSLLPLPSFPEHAARRHAHRGAA